MKISDIECEQSPFRLADMFNRLSFVWTFIVEHEVGRKAKKVKDSEDGRFWFIFPWDWDDVHTFMADGRPCGHPSDHEYVKPLDNRP